MEIGRVNFAEGEYLGQVSNGKANGFGRLIYNNGDIYVGEWQDNCQTGKGAKNTKEYASLGTFLNGKRQGKFCTVEKNVDSNGRDKSSWYNRYYIGEYKNDVKNGHGVYVKGNSVYYAYWGNFVNDKLNGHGFYAHTPHLSGGYFDEGDFVDDKMMGKIKSYARREKTQTGECFYGDSEERGWGDFTYSGFGVWGSPLANRVKTILIGYHNMYSSSDFKGLKIYKNFCEDTALAVGDWGRTKNEKNGYFSNISYSGNLDMGDYKHGKCCGRGISFDWNASNDLKKMEIDDGNCEVTIYPCANLFLKIRNKGTKNRTLFCENGDVFFEQSSNTEKSKTNILTYQGVLNGGQNLTSSNCVSSMQADSPTPQNATNAKTVSDNTTSKNNEAKPVATTSQPQKKQEKTLDDYFEEFKYTGPYADLTIDDLPTNDWGKSKPIEREKPTFAPIQTQKNAYEPIPAQNKGDQKTEQNINYYGDEYGEKLSFKDRIKLEIANKKQMREAKKAKAEQHSQPATSQMARGANERIKQLNEEYEFRDGRKEIVSVKVKKQIHNIPSTVQKIDEKVFYCDKVVKEIKINSYLSFPTNCFSGCENLEKIDLSSMGYLTIKQNMFKDCINLKQIKISNFPNIEIEDENAFENVTKVKIISKNSKTKYDLDNFLAKFLKNSTQKSFYEQKVAKTNVCESNNAQQKVKASVVKKEETKTLISVKKPAPASKDVKSSVDSSPNEKGILRPAKLVTGGSSAWRSSMGAILEQRGDDIYLKGYLAPEEVAVVPAGVTLIDNASFDVVKDVVVSIIIDCEGADRHITELKSGIFAGLEKLKRVMAESVVLIQKDAFKGLVNLESVTVSKKCKVKLGAFPKGLKVKKSIVAIRPCVGGRRIDYIHGKKFVFSKKK